jgi:hypothetical protein
MRSVAIGGVWFASLFLAFWAGAVVYENRAILASEPSPSRPAADQVVDQDEIVRSNLYDLRLHTLEGPFERYGGIAAVRDGILVTPRSGRFLFVRERHKVSPLRLRVPLNLEDFESDPDVPRDVRKDLVGVKDILVDRAGPAFRLFASYQHWDVDQNCMTLRVSTTRFHYDELFARTTSGDNGWKLLFVSDPCLSLEQRGREAFMSEEAGGRMALLSSERLLLTTGDNGLAGLTGGPMPAQDPHSSYGKTIVVDLKAVEAKVFTIGHRNPQGLAVTPEGQVWLTEHGPRGGDELNLIQEGKNYGWPLVSYGRECGVLDCTGHAEADLSVTLNRNVGEHAQFEKPVYSWVPSIGVSNLIVVTDGPFRLWKDDLLVSSLGARTLYRVRIRDGRAVVVEPVVSLENRIRDIVETTNGTIVMKTDAGNKGKLVFMSLAGDAS